MILPVDNSVKDLLIPSEIGSVGHASAWLESTCLENDVPESEISRLDLCLNEALANIIYHNDVARPFTIRLSLAINQNSIASEAVVTIHDSGKPFDPLSALPKSKPKTLAEAEPGGLGILMIRKFSDNQHYRYIEGYNQLSFGCCWPKEP